MCEALTHKRLIYSNKYFSLSKVHFLYIICTKTSTSYMSRSYSFWLFLIVLPIVVSFRNLRHPSQNYTAYSELTHKLSKYRSGTFKFLNLSYDVIKYSNYFRIIQQKYTWFPLSFYVTQRIRKFTTRLKLNLNVIQSSQKLKSGKFRSKQIFLLLNHNFFVHFFQNSWYLSVFMKWPGRKMTFCVTNDIIWINLK